MLSVNNLYAKAMKITPQAQAAWLRTLCKRFVAIGSFVVNLPCDQRLALVEAGIVASVFMSVVKEIIIPPDGALEALLKVPSLMAMKARELVTMLTSFEQIFAALTCCRIDGFMRGKTPQSFGFNYFN